MCKECEKNPVYEFTNKRKLCEKCFVRYFQKKFLYIIRKFEMIKREDIIAYENKNDFRGVVLEDLLNMFIEKARVEVVKLPTKRKFDKKAISANIDLESDKIAHILIKKDAAKLKEIAPVNGKIIKPLYLFLDKEILLYAKIKKLKFKDTKIKQDKISQFIEKLEEKHPEIKRAIINSYLELFS